MSDAARPARAARQQGIPAGHRRSRVKPGLTLALVLFAAAESTTLVGIFAGRRWWVYFVGVSVLTLALAAVLRAFRVPRVAASALSLLVPVVWVLLDYCRGTTIAAVVPTPATWSLLAADYSRAATLIRDDVPPAWPDPVLLMFVVVLGGVAAAVLDLLAIGLRLPALIAVAGLAVVTVPSITLERGVSPWSLMLCFAAFLLVLAVDGWGRMRRGGLLPTGLVIAAAAVIALFCTSVVPATGGVSWKTLVQNATNTATTQANTDPLVDLARNLISDDSSVVLDYETTETAPLYLQLTTLDRLDGTSWLHTSSATLPVADDGTVGGTTARSPHSTTSADSETVVSLGDLTGDHLPVPTDPLAIVSVRAPWTIEGGDDTVSVPAGVAGRTYSVVAAAPPTPGSAPPSAPSALPPAVGADLALPADVPGIITSTARGVTAKDTSEIEMARSLQDYLRDGDFTYSTDTPDPAGASGVAVVAAFLQRKTGYCVHFASAMAIMARVLGIPSRIAVGYLPGTPAGTGASAGLPPSTSPSYAVTANELHAWPQLYFVGQGWLNFEPTVGQGATPSYAPDEAPAAIGSGVTPSAAPQELPARTDRPHSLQNASPSPSSSSRSTATAVAAGPGSGMPQLPLLLVAGLLVLVLGALAPTAPLLARRLRRARRLARIRAGTAGAGVAWRELLDTARRRGIRIGAAETPRAAAARIADGARSADAAVGALLAAIERDSYGPPGLDGVDRDIEARRPDGEALASSLVDAVTALEASPRHAPQH